MTAQTSPIQLHQPVVPPPVELSVELPVVEPPPVVLVVELVLDVPEVLPPEVDVPIPVLEAAPVELAPPVAVVPPVLVLLVPVPDAEEEVLPASTGDALQAARITRPASEAVERRRTPPLAAE